LPVRNLPRNVEFLTALGFTFDPRFTYENATSMVADDCIHVMLLVSPSFPTFTDRRIADSRTQTAALVGLSSANDAAADELVDRAVAAGGRAHRSPQDHGFMYAHGFEDPDGHLWELAHMRSMPA